MSWQDNAECKGLTDLMFPGRGDNEGHRKAKAICADCPVRAECLEYALTNGETHGTWGGTSERERRRMRRELRVQGSEAA